MPRPTADIQTIIRLGGSIIIDASTKTTQDLQTYARLINVSGGKIILRNTDRIPIGDLETLVRLAPGKVIMEI